MAKLTAMAVLILSLLAAGCGDDDGDAGRLGAGGDAPGDLGDAVDDVLDDLADGSLDEGSLEDLQDQAEDLAQSFGDPGAGTVEINGDTIDFTSEICFAGQGDFTIEGIGATGDGTPVWVSISKTVDSRAELAEFFDEAMLTQLYGDADPIVVSTVSLEYGRSELFGNGDDELPSFDASTGEFSNSQVEIDIDGNSASGSGEAQDFNAAAGDFGDTFPFTFRAGCN